MSGDHDETIVADYTPRYTTEAPFQYSDKIGDGIILVRGDSFTEFVGNLIEVFGPEGADSRLDGFAKKEPVAQAQQNLTNAGVATETVGKSCQHGQMTKHTGTSSRGPWTGYFCPLPKGDPNQCKAVFV